MAAMVLQVTSSDLNPGGLDADREDASRVRIAMETDTRRRLPAPSLPAGMVLLKAFADAHAHSFEFIQPEDFVHFENEAFTGIEEWDLFARHCLSCYACREL